MSRIYPLDITLEDYHDTTIDSVIGEIEEAVENIRKYHGDGITHTQDVDIDELLADHGEAAVIWTADDVREVVPRLNDDQALAVIKECFRSFAPEETANRDLIFATAKRLYPNLNHNERSTRADQTICAYAGGSVRENLVDFLTDAMLWCEGIGERFDEFCDTARMHFAAECMGDTIKPKGE